MTYPASGLKLNNDRGPDTRTKSFWGSAVGSDLTTADLVWGDSPPRRIYIGSAGTLVLTHADGNGSTYDDTVSVTAGTEFFKNTIVGVKASGSSAFKLTFGW